LSGRKEKVPLAIETRSIGKLPFGLSLEAASEDHASPVRFGDTPHPRSDLIDVRHTVARYMVARGYGICSQKSKIKYQVT
jgi:hypothetical protein